MDKRYIVTLSPIDKGRIRVTVIDQKYFNTLHDYKTHLQFKGVAITTLKAMYGEEIVFLDKTEGEESWPSEDLPEESNNGNSK